MSPNLLNREQKTLHLITLIYSLGNHRRNISAILVTSLHHKDDANSKNSKQEVWQN